MTAQIKVKVQRKAIVKLKVLPKFPASVVAGAGVLVTKVANTYTFAYDPAFAFTFSGGVFTGITSLGIRDTSAPFDVTLAATSSPALTAGRTLTLNLSNAASTVTLNGNANFGGPFAITGSAAGLVLNLSGSTNVTLPTTGTLVGRATTDTLTNKTFDTAGTGNSFLINGLAATANTGTGGAVVRSISPVFGGTPSIAGGTSGSTTLAVAGVASGTLTLPSATDTLIGKATTDTLTNKTYDTAGTGNSFSINGVAVTANSGTGPMLRSTSPTLGIVGGTLGAIAFANVTSGFITIQAPTGALGTPTLTLPIATDTLIGKATTDTLTNKTISGSSNTLSNIALSSHSTQAAYTIVGNFTGSAAVPTASALSGLTQKVTPASTDLVLIQDQAASGQLKYATVSAVGASSGVSSIAGNTGAFTLSIGLTNAVNDLRVSLSTFTNYATGNVTLNSATFTDGPSVAQGTTGVFLAVGTVTLLDSAAGSAFQLVRIWDGTTTYSSVATNTPGSSGNSSVTLSAIVTNPAGNLRLSAKSQNATSSIRFNDSGLSKDSGIVVIRVG